MAESLDPAVQAYIDAIEPDHRPLFDRLHQLITSRYPDAEVTISYQIPSYKRNKRRLYLGAWKHGVSLYGWHDGHDGGFVARHPELMSGRSTLKLRPEAAAAIDDSEFLALIDSTLGDPPS